MPTIDSKKPVWIVLGSAMLVHALLLSFQTSQRFNTDFMRGWILDGLAPMEKLVDRTLHGTGSTFDRYFALIGIHDENAQLHAEVDRLKMQIAAQQEAVTEADRLRKFVGLDDSRLGTPVVARVIGRDPTRSHQSITIDKGRANGIQPDAAVMTPEGIVGRVIHAGNYSAIVQLIVDSQSGVGILLLPSRRLGIIKGTGDAELDLDFIDDDSELKVGDLMITSGADRIYPKGLPVGRVTSVGARKGLFKMVRIRPTADLGRLEEVLCVVDKPKSVETFPMETAP